MRVLVTGVKGQLGYDVMNELKKQGLTGIGVDVDEMDITDAEACRRVITEAKPDAVIHCAAYTAVDAAEQNMELCRKVYYDVRLFFLEEFKHKVAVCDIAVYKLVIRLILYRFQCL